MTTFASDNRPCGHCGATVECTLLASTNRFGSPDLDLRPPEMERSTMHMWLQACPTCGYVAYEIEEPTPGADAVIGSASYQALINAEQIPETASRFLRYALLHPDEHEAAGNARLRAAWACDDAGAVELAQRYREEAAADLLSLRPFADDEGSVTTGVVLVDVLRRAGRHAEASELVAELQSLRSAAQETIAAVLAFQQQRCDQADTNGYTIADAVGGG